MRRTGNKPCARLELARTAYGAEPAFTVQSIIVSGILRWEYEVQVWSGR